MGFQEPPAYDTTLEVKRTSTTRSQAPEYKKDIKKTQAGFVFKKSYN